MTFEISVEEQLERQSDLRAEEILPAMAEERESALAERERWKTALLSGGLVALFLGWLLISIVEPRLNFFGPLISGPSSAKLSPSDAGPGGDSSYLHSDENLVKLVQYQLNRLGFHVGSVDGVVGPRTMEGLERFQMSQGLSVTGVIDRQTVEALDRAQLPKAKSKPYMIARARREKDEEGGRFLIDLSVDPALSQEAVVKYVKEVTRRYAKSNPDVSRFHVRAYLGIASLSAGAYAIADWDRKGRDVRSLDGLQVRFQEWTRDDFPTGLPPPRR
ncbi:MAG: peptidoglycan-binding protein [Nitrospinota bacterium]